MIFSDLFIQGSTSISSSATKATLLAFFVTFLLDSPDLTADLTSGSEHESDLDIGCGGRKKDLKIGETNILNVGSTHVFLTTSLKGC